MTNHKNRRTFSGGWWACPILFVALTTASPAMEIEKFDRMAHEDRKEYVIELIEGAQKVLRDEGRGDLAEKVAELFTTNAPESNISIGMSMFTITLAKARVADLKRLEKDPKATRLEVEHAMILTLKKNDIELPKSYMQVMNNFIPKYPAQKQ